MLDIQTFLNVSGDFSTSGTNTEPDASKRTSGFIANEGFPHENENFFMNLMTHNNTLFTTALTNIEGEIKTVLTAAGLTPNGLLVNQLLAGIQYQIQNNSAITNITNTTDSTLYTNGALIVSGGLGVAKNMNVAGNIKALSFNILSTSLNLIFGYLWMSLHPVYIHKYLRIHQKTLLMDFF